MIQLNLVVLRATNPADLVQFYGDLGLMFKMEQHGKGPIHYSCACGSVILEIYPLLEADRKTTATRIGFSVDNIEQVIEVSKAFVVSPPQQSPWGWRAVVLDPEGHTIELVQSS